MRSPGSITGAHPVANAPRVLVAPNLPNVSLFLPAELCFPPATHSRRRHAVHVLRYLKKLRKCSCGDGETAAAAVDAPAGADEHDRPKDACPVEEAAYFSENEDDQRDNAGTKSREGASTSATEGASGSTSSPWPEPCEKCTALFYRELDKSMKATSRAYFRWVSKILSSAPLAQHKPWWRKALGGGCADSGGGNARVVADLFCGAGTSSSAGSKGKSPDGADEEEGDVNFGGLDLDLETEARECLHWIELNSTALRKILKKWDKTNHSSKGREQLRKYWSDSKYQMLYSPLILELRAVAGMLEGGGEGPHWKLDGTDGDGEDNLDHLGVGDGNMLTCSICLDVLYKPVGLACGHVFCGDCLLQNAGILKEGATLADLRSEVSSVRHEEIDESRLPPPPPGMVRRKRARRDRCPECRTDDVFATSVRLRHVQQCLKEVDPEGYQARKAESRKFRSKLESDARLNKLVGMLMKMAKPSGVGL